jgi:hypothetical protein
MSVLTQNVFGPLQAITEKVGHFSASRPNSRGQRNPQPVAGDHAADQRRLLTPGERPVAAAPGRLFGGLPPRSCGVPSLTLKRGWIDPEAPSVSPGGSALRPIWSMSGPPSPETHLRRRCRRHGLLRADRREPTVPYRTRLARLRPRGAARPQRLKRAALAGC